MDKEKLKQALCSLTDFVVDTTVDNPKWTQRTVSDQHELFQTMNQKCKDVASCIDTDFTPMFVVVEHLAEMLYHLDGEKEANASRTNKRNAKR